MSSVYVHTPYHHLLYLRTHTHTHTVFTVYVHTTTPSSPSQTTMYKARTTLNMAGEGSFESAQFFLSC